MGVSEASRLLGAGGLRREALPGKWPVATRPRAGRQHRSHERRGPLPVPSRLQVLHLRNVVDPAGSDPRHRGALADDPAPGAHRRGAEPDLARAAHHDQRDGAQTHARDRKSTRLNSSHVKISYAVFCLKKKKIRISGESLVSIVMIESVTDVVCHLIV